MMKKVDWKDSWSARPQSVKKTYAGGVGASDKSTSREGFPLSSDEKQIRSN